MSVGRHYQYDQTSTEYDQTLCDHLMFDFSILYGYLKQKYRTFESRLDEMYRTYDKFVAVSLLSIFDFQFLNKKQSSRSEVRQKFAATGISNKFTNECFISTFIWDMPDKLGKLRKIGKSKASRFIINRSRNDTFRD